MKKAFHHILSSDPIAISCDIDIEKYFIQGEEVIQDEIITVLAETFDTEQTRQDILDDMSCLHDEIENNGMSDRKIEKLWPNRQQHMWA